MKKKVKKVKSYERVIDMTSPQIPIPLKMTEYFVSPTTEAQKMEGQGMVFQKTFVMVIQVLNLICKVAKKI